MTPLVTVIRVSIDWLGQSLYVTVTYDAGVELLTEETGGDDSGVV